MDATTATAVNNYRAALATFETYRNDAAAPLAAWHVTGDLHAAAQALAERLAELDEAGEAATFHAAHAAAAAAV